MFMLTLALSTANAQNLIGHWEFDGATPTVDATGNFGTLALSGATLTGEGLAINAGQSAVANGYSGPTVNDKTLVSYVRIDNTAVQSGSALTLQDSSGNSFDGIVYGERVSNHWMAGSNFFARTVDVAQIADTDTTAFRKMAISYENINASQVRITLCKDNVQLGTYVANTRQSYTTNAQALFGRRHQSTGTLEATIAAASIYDEAIACPDIPDVTEPADCDPGQDTEVCEGAVVAFDAIEAVAPGTLDESGPMRLRPSTLRANLQVLKDAAVAEGCGTDLVLQSIGGSYGGGVIDGSGDSSGDLDASYSRGHFSGQYTNGDELGGVFGRFTRRGRFVGDSNGASDRTFAGTFVRTTGAMGVYVGFELSCSVDPGSAFDAWSGMNVPTFD